MTSFSAMQDENKLIYSALNQTCTWNSRSVVIRIYRLPNTGWTGEVIDENHNTTVWDGEFETDQEALNTVLSDIKMEGINAFIADASSQNLRRFGRVKK